MGCYNLASEFTVIGDTFSDDNSPAKCAEWCYAQQVLYYSGVTGTACYCSTGLTDALTAAGSEDCDQACPGQDEGDVSARDNCGGDGKVNVFHREVPTVTRRSRFQTGW